MHFFRKLSGKSSSPAAQEAEAAPAEAAEFTSSILREDDGYLLVQQQAAPQAADSAPAAACPSSASAAGAPVRLFKDCRSLDEKVAWVHSEQGQAVLSKRPVLLHYFETGQLVRLLSNRHWTARLEAWLTPSEAVPFGLHLPLTEDEKEKLRDEWIGPRYTNPPLAQHFSSCWEGFQHETMALENRLELVADGFTVLRGVVPMHVLEIANAAAAELLAQGTGTDLSYLGDRRKMAQLKPNPRNQDPFFISGGTNHLDILSLYYASPVAAMIEHLLHGDHRDKGQAQRAAVHGAQVAFRMTMPRIGASSSGKVGGSSWHVDGLDRGKYGSFSLLVGFPLNDQADAFSGNLCLHAGSHHTLQPYLKNYAMQALVTESDAERAQVHRLPRPDLGEPVQVRLNAGDVVIALHKVAHLGGPNYSQEVRKMIYMRVSHAKHAELRVDALDDLWIEYEGLHDLVYG